MVEGIIFIGLVIGFLLIYVGLKDQPIKKPMKKVTTYKFDDNGKVVEKKETITF